MQADACIKRGELRAKRSSSHSSNLYWTASVLFPFCIFLSHVRYGTMAWTAAKVRQVKDIPKIVT